ncbi:hypothetical protein ACFS6H_19985 [Terrimonas rubra]|uniref:Uncharacterized protein n=1 Tax=Terrimonas rubra TaxID=1035890 RepID=A0ABW6AD70_9BACT
MMYLSGWSIKPEVSTIKFRAQTLDGKKRIMALLALLGGFEGNKDQVKNVGHFEHDMKLLRAEHNLSEILDAISKHIKDDADFPAEYKS